MINAQNHKDLKQELADIKVELNTVINRAEAIDTVNKEQAVRINVLEDKVQEYELEKRSHNVIVAGLPESNNEDIRATIDNLLNNIGCNFMVEWCDSVYRMGVRSEGNKRGRPVKVVFPYLRYKHLFFKNLYKLKNMPEWKGTYANDDLTPVKQAERKEMRAVFSYAKSKNIDCQLRGAKPIVDKRPYTYVDMKNLPHGLSIEAAKI